MIPFGAVAGLVSGAGSLIGGIASSKAAKSAASAETGALQKGIDFQQSVYNQGQTNLNPFIGGGQSALQSLLGFYGLPGGNASGASQGFSQFQQTPFYQFPLQQSTLATNRALAASGLTGSGGQLRDLSQLNAGYASQGLTGYLGGLGGLLQGGQSAATSLLSAGNTAAASLGNLYGNQGAAQAGGIIGSNNALQQGIQNALPAFFGAPGGSTSPIGSTSYTSPFGGGIVPGLLNGFNNGFGNSYSGSPLSGSSVNNLAPAVSQLGQL